MSGLAKEWDLVEKRLAEMKLRLECHVRDKATLLADYAALRVENERLTNEIGRLCERLRAENAGLREALETIANCGYVCDLGDDHMRETARAALSQPAQNAAEKVCEIEIEAIEPEVKRWWATLPKRGDDK
jgi:hypothetical protein